MLFPVGAIHPLNRTRGDFGRLADLPADLRDGSAQLFSHRSNRLDIGRRLSGRRLDRDFILRREAFEDLLGHTVTLSSAPELTEFKGPCSIIDRLSKFCSAACAAARSLVRMP